MAYRGEAFGGREREGRAAGGARERKKERPGEKRREGEAELEAYDSTAWRGRRRAINGGESREELKGARHTQLTFFPLLFTPLRPNSLAGRHQPRVLVHSLAMYETSPSALSFGYIVTEGVGIRVSVPAAAPTPTPGVAAAGSLCVTVKRGRRG